MLGGGEMSVIKEGLSEEVTLEQKPEWKEKVGRSGESVLSTCKDWGRNQLSLFKDQPEG